MIPYLLAVAGGYFIGNSMNETTPQFGKGGKMDDKKAYADLDTYDLEGLKETGFLKENNISTKVIYKEPGEVPVVRYTGTKETLKKMIDKYWLQDGHMDDAELWYAEIKEIKNLVNVK